jgi:hypothetical protein
MNRLTPLAVAFVVLGALVAWRETTRGSMRNLSEEANLKSLSVRAFTADDVGTVEITAPGGDKPAYSLVREDRSWRVLGAFKAPASGGVVAKLLDALAKAEGEFRSDDKAALEQFGLTHAKSVGVRVLDKDGKELLHLAVGATANQRGAFVRDVAEGRDDSKAYSVGADVRGLLGLSRTSVGDHEPDKPDAAHFYDKDFPQLAVEKPTRVEFTAPGRVVAFEKAGKDEKEKKPVEWKLATGGPDAPVKKEAIDIAIAKLGGSFHPTGLVDPAKKKELGLDAPKYRVSVATESGAPRVVVASSDAACEHFYVRIDAAQDPEVVYEANEYEFHQLFPTGAALFDLPKVDTTKDAPTRIVVERKGRETIEMTRKGTKPADDWTLVRPAWPLAAKQTSLRTLSTQPGAVHAVDYVDDATAPESEVTARFGAAGAPDDRLKTIVVGGKAPAGKDRLATLPGSARVFVVSDNVDRLAPEPLSLFETRIFHDWKKDDVTAVRVAGGAGVVKNEDAWGLDVGGEKRVADKTAVLAWLDKLLALDVVGVPPAAGKDETFTTVTVERKEGAPVAVDIGPVVDGKRTVKIGEFRATVVDAPGLLPDAASLAPKPAEPAKKDEK